MLGWHGRKTSHQERQLAWRATVGVAARAPFLGIVDDADPDSHVGSVVYDSAAVTAVLRKLANGISPERTFIPTLLEAIAAFTRVEELRPSWIDYCNEHYGLDPAATDAVSEMSRQYVRGETVRAWSRFDAAQAALGQATKALRKLQSELADFCGTDITAGRKAA